MNFICREIQSVQASIADVDWKVLSVGKYSAPAPIDLQVVTLGIYQHRPEHERICLIVQQLCAKYATSNASAVQSVSGLSAQLQLWINIKGSE